MDSNPIRKYRDTIVNAIENNQVTIIVGETGSGKTTEIPQILYEEGLGQKGAMIGIIEPRRIAAVSVAEFVASKLDIRLGKGVAHKVRFDDETNSNTVVKFMTDGVLLRELLGDPLLSNYSIIVIDEAHERSVYIDLLMGLLKQLLRRRPELRLVIASATIDSEKFSQYFGGAPIIRVTGRSFEVRIIWSDDNPTSWDEIEDKAIKAIFDILDTSRTGDILVFLTGAGEIRLMTQALSELLEGLYPLVILPAHRGLSSEELGKIFLDYSGMRKIILATNIAETSLTINGIEYVVDTGRIKQTEFDAVRGIESLIITKHSRAGCDQRLGRAGRTKPGTCYRLYTESSYQERDAFTAPEIRRVSIVSAVLTMEALGIPDVRNFDFIDRPDEATFADAYGTLLSLGAVRPESGLTDRGREMAALPVDPALSRMILEAKKYGCMDDMLTIAAFLSLDHDVFISSMGRETEASRAHMQFSDARSDLLTLLNIWWAWVHNGRQYHWCSENFLSHKTLLEVRMIKQQLRDMLLRSGVEISTTRNEECLLKCAAAGLVHNILAYDTNTQTYKGVERKLPRVDLESKSVLSRARVKWTLIVAVNISHISSLCARICSVVYPDWLPDILPETLSFGAVALQHYSNGDTLVRATQPIVAVKTGTIVGHQELLLTIAEAHKIQCELIKRAKASGWRFISVRKTTDSNGNVHWIGTIMNSQKKGRSKAKKIFVRKMDGMTEGSQWYCDSQHVPRLQVFPLSQPPETAVASAE